jgi:hypothetical protein
MKQAILAEMEVWILPGQNPPIRVTELPIQALG